MPVLRDEIESVRPDPASQLGPHKGQDAGLQYLDTVIAALAVFALAWGADMATGKRGLFGSSLVAGTGALCGWFIAVRVLARYTNEDWGWLVWALGGAALCLALYTLFRSKR